MAMVGMRGGNKLKQRVTLLPHCRAHVQQTIEVSHLTIKLRAFWTVEPSLRKGIQAHHLGISPAFLTRMVLIRQGTETSLIHDATL